MCFFINLIAFCEGKKFEGNLEAGYKYSDYILSRDLRNGHCLQQLIVVIYIKHFSHQPLESSPESHRLPPRVNRCSCSFLLCKSSSSDAESVFQAQTHRGHQHSHTGCHTAGAASCMTFKQDMSTHRHQVPSPPRQQSLKLRTGSTHSALPAHTHVYSSGSLKYQHDPALCPTLLNSSQALLSSLAGLVWGSPAKRWML